MKAKTPKLLLINTSLTTFKTRLERFMDQRVPSAFSDTLFAHLSPLFLNMGPEERCSELSRLEPNATLGVLHHQLLYSFINISVGKSRDLMYQLRNQPIGKAYIVRMELEPFHREINKWLGIEVSSFFRDGLYYHLSLNFLDNSSPKARYDELCHLRFDSGFMSYLEKDYATYLFLKKSVDHLPEFIEGFKKNRLGQIYIIPIEKDLFNQEMAKIGGKPVSRTLTDKLFRHLGADFFAKTPQDKCSKLLEQSMNPEFLTCLEADDVLTDKFLRQASGNLPELLTTLTESSLSAFIIPECRSLCNQRLADLMGQDVPWAFSNALSEHLTVEFFDKPDQRYERLFTLRRNRGFFTCLMSNKELADVFLRRSVNEAEIDRLEKSRLGHCLIHRHVRKRGRVESSKPLLHAPIDHRRARLFQPASQEPALPKASGFTVGWKGH